MHGFCVLQMPDYKRRLSVKIGKEHGCLEVHNGCMGGIGDMDPIVSKQPRRPVHIVSSQQVQPLYLHRVHWNVTAVLWDWTLNPKLTDSFMDLAREDLANNAETFGVLLGTEVRGGQEGGIGVWAKGGW